MRPNYWGYLYLDRYEGKINRWGLPHGEGIQYRANGSVLFKGEFKNGFRDGPGIEYYDSSTWTPTMTEGNIRFDGEWKDGARNGRGIWYDRFPGNRFEGEWKDGKANGLCIEIDGNRRCEVVYKDDEPNGPGIEYSGDRVIFKGEFKDGLRDGPGIEYRSNGERFEGMWKWGQLHGLGIYYKADGSISLRREFEATPEIQLHRSRSAYS